MVFFVPGLSSPYHEKYTPLYTALVSEAESRGYKPKVLLLPGQISSKGVQEGVLSLSTARVKLEEELKAVISQEGTLVRVVGFSFGCTVALSVIRGAIGLNLSRTVLWGAVPFWQSWQAFRMGNGRSYLGKSTNMAPDDQFFDDLMPVEHLLLEVKSKVTIAAGTDDVYCTASYLNYLKTLSAERGLANVDTIAVPDCTHTPHPSEKGWQKFIETVLD